MEVRRYLVIANQTLAEAELTEAIRQRMEAGPSSFYALVPNTGHGDLVARIARRIPIGPAAADTTAATSWPSNKLSTGSASSPTTSGVGADVEGDLGDEDPIKAADQLLESRQFDEIILSTLPQHLSRWLGMDLPHRLLRHTELPMATITTKRVL